MKNIIEELFKNSSICAGLIDSEYNVILKPYAVEVPSKEQLQSAVQGPVYLEDKTALLQSFKVDNGYFFQYKDVYELMLVEEELKDTGDYLLEENAALDEAAGLEEARRRTAEQNRLFDGIAESLQPQLNRLDGILTDLPDDERSFRREMKYAGVLGAFIKRYSNLLLLSASGSRTDSFELYLCINESFLCLRLLNISCYADIQQGIELPVSYELLMYGLFESVIESVLPLLSAVLVTLKRDENGLIYYIEVSDENASFDDGFFKAAESAGFIIETERSDGCFFVVLRSGGEADI